MEDRGPETSYLSLAQKEGAKLRQEGVSERSQVPVLLEAEFVPERALMRL
jgi:hypothetical protein